MDAILCLDKRAVQGATTVAFSATLGTAASWALANFFPLIGTVDPLIGGAIAMYASAISIFATSYMREHQWSDPAIATAFFAAVVVTTLALSFAATTLGFSISPTLAVVLSLTNIASAVLGLNVFQQR